MIIAGIDLSELPDQFQGVQHKPGVTLILDGDGPCYRATSSAAKLETAIRRFETEVLTTMFLTGCTDVEIHLTPKHCLKCDRALYPSAKPYQGNRKGKAKPPLLEVLRHHLLTVGLPHREDWRIQGSAYFEADDTMMMSSYRLQEQGLIWSDDKDLCITPYPYWMAKSARASVLDSPFGFITLTCTSTGSLKIIGHGRKFFWTQMLMGDSADNIQGLKRLNGKLCGPAGAYAALEKMEDERACAEFVLRAFQANQQNPLAEAELLWLRRTPEDSAAAYISSLGLPTDLQVWIQALDEYHQKYKEYKREETSQIADAALEEEAFEG